MYLSLRQEETSSFHLFNIKALFWYYFHVPALAGCTFRKLPLPAWLSSPQKVLLEPPGEIGVVSRHKASSV